MTEDRPVCPECKKPMMKNGKRWVGKGNQRQKWLCSGCGAETQTKMEVKK
jgi:transposase-like protein